MPKHVLLATSAVFALLATGEVRAGVIRPALSVKTEPKHGLVFPHRGSRLIYDQNDNDAGIAIVAQNFESVFDNYDCEAADDFRVPARKAWLVTEIYAAGSHFNGTGPANSFNVTFYTSKKGNVGKPVKTCLNADYIETDFGDPLIKCKAKLNKGAYFVAIQANIDFSTGGEWGWLTNNTVRRNPSLWRNPNDGFGTGCTEFEPTTTCVGEDAGGDYAFAVYGKQSSGL